jgi:hypothetical protein
MTGLVRKASLLSVCGLFIAGSAMAFVPSPVTSSIPCAVNLVGSNAPNTTTDPLGDFTITIKDIAGNPIQNSAVVVDFSGCCNDIHLSTTQHGAGVTLDAPNKRILATTNASGQVTLRIQGAATKSAVTPGNIGCAKILADNVLISDGINHPAVNVGVFDLDGAVGGNGVGAADLSQFLTDSFAASYRQRADYDHSSACVFAVGAPDLSKLLTLSFAAGSGTNGPAYTACP